MNWWKRFWSNPYKWGLWYWIGGRPWTYIIRDARIIYPTPWMLGVMIVSATIGHYFWGWLLLVGFLGGLIGILWGHLWWGTEHIPGQQGK